MVRKNLHISKLLHNTYVWSPKNFPLTLIMSEGVGGGFNVSNFLKPLDTPVNSKFNHDKTNQKYLLFLLFLQKKYRMDIITPLPK